MKRFLSIALLLFSSAAYCQTTPLSNMTATFNDGGTVFNAIKMDIANTASAAGSTALWLGFSATPVFRVETDGAVLLGTITTGVWNGTTISIADGGTGEITAQAAIDALTDVASATNEFVLTKDTATGNAIFKASAGGGGGDVTKVGTPVDNQVGVWTGDGTLEGDPDLVFDGTNLGIGTTAPIGGVEVAKDGALLVGGAFSVYSNTASHEPLFYLRRGRGTLASPAGLQDGDILGTVRWAGQKSTALGNYTTVGKIEGIARGTYTNTSLPFDMAFYTTLTGSTTPAERMRIDSAGLVGINNTGPAAQLDITAAASTVGLNILQAAASTALFLNLNATPGDSITIADSSAENIFIVDGAGTLIFGEDSPTPALRKIHGQSGLGTNIGGEDLYLVGGQSTGSGIGGDVIVQVGLSGASGASKNALTTMANISDNNGFVITPGAFRPGLGIDLNATSTRAFRIRDSANKPIFEVLPDGEVQIESDNFPALGVERFAGTTNGVITAMVLRARSTGAMADGFGSAFLFQLEDNSAVQNNVADFNAVRDGADNTGKLVFRPYLAGSAVEAMVVTSAGFVGINETAPEAFVEVTVTADADRFYQMTTSDDTKLWWEQETAGVNGDFTFQNDIGDVMKVFNHVASPVFPNQMSVGIGGVVVLPDTDISLSVQSETTATNTVTRVAEFQSTSSGTPSAFIGSGFEFVVETAVGNNEIGGAIEVLATDVAATNEDFAMRFFTMLSGDVATEVMRLNSAGFMGIGTNAPASGLEMGDDKLIAKDVNAGLTASTTQTQAGGLALTAQVNDVSTVAANDDTVVLPPLPATGSLEIIIINNDSAESIRVFPASGDDLGAGGDTADAVNIPSGVVRKYISYDATNWIKYISEP